MSKVFVISDLHLGHQNILFFKKEGGHPLREFSSLDEMLEILAWLEGKKVASFIIIDDSEDAAHEGNGTLPIFIHTDYDQGIPFNNYQACYAHFTWC